MRIITAGWVTSSLVVLGVIVAGCADPRPATETSESELQEGTSASGSTALATRTCTPGTARDCKTFWTDHAGELHCNLEIQICRADGYAWQPCGERDAGAAPDAGGDANAEPDDAGAANRG